MWCAIVLSTACLANVIAADGYIESVAASVDGGSAQVHTSFMPLVAFKCGYRNMHTDTRSTWTNDADRYATCMTSKYDILKYCRRVYPTQNITNVVEYDHQVTIDNWCKEEGTPCKWSHTVRPFRCIVGEFESRALLVPNGCRFGHVDERQSCEPFEYWQSVADDECGRHTGADARTMRVRSFAVIDACGLAKFKSVEFVCCPQTVAVTTPTPTAVPTTPKAAPKKLVSSEQRASKSDAIEETVFDKDKKKSTRKITKKTKDLDDDEDDEEYFDDDKDEDDDEYDEKKADEIIMGEIRNEDDVTTTKASPAKNKPLLGGDGEDDPYFRVADPEHEHQLYREAVTRVIGRHHQRMVAVMKEWAESQTRYEKLKKTDVRAADAYKAETKEKFRATVAALDNEIQDQRAQIDEVHQERVQARLNERKREAIRHYRDVLAASLTDPRPADVLSALTGYIRAEEKDRTHSLQHYVHLLRAQPTRAAAERGVLIGRLHDIDTRINASMAMLADFPAIVEKVRPEALRFWADYRRENTPRTTDALATSIGGAGKDVRVLSIYEQQVRAEQSAVSTLETGVDSSEAALSAKLSPDLVAQMELLPGVEPVMNVELQLEDAHQSHAQQARLVHEHTGFDSEPMLEFNEPSSSHSVFALAGAIVFVVAVVATILTYRRRSRQRQGFIEVDLYTPEERHVATMQHNGYENPTYTYFEKA